MALPGQHLTVFVRENADVEKCIQVCECVHGRHELYVILMQQHEMQHPRPQDTQHAAFVCTLCELSLQCQLDVRCVTAKCKMRLKWELVMVSV